MKQKLSRLTLLIGLGLLALTLNGVLKLAPSATAQAPDIKQLNELVYLPFIVGAPPVASSQWQAQSSGTNSTLTDISCPNDNTCFALGTDGVIVATTDGGNTWQTKRTSDGTIYKGGISCPTTTSCFVVGYGGTIVTTNDGGKTWSKQSEGSRDLYSISCADANNCLAVGDRSQTYYTSNGGDNWTALSLGTTPLYSVDCPTSKYCLMVGLGRVVSLINGNRRGNLINTGNYVHNGVVCPSPTQCFMVGNEMSNSGDNTMKGVAHGVNSDVTDLVPRIVGTVDRLNDVNCPGTSLTTCYAVGAGISKNGSQYLPANEAKGSVFVTTDAGSTWTTETLAITNKDIYALDCPTTAQTCYAVGQDGLILAKK